MKTSDIVVIGGGIIGCAVAYYSAKEGAQVSLVEKGFLGSSTTATQSNLSLQARALGPELDLALESMNIYLKLEDELDFVIDYKRTGSCRFTSKKERWESLKTTAKKQREQGLKNHLLNKQQLKEKFKDVICSKDIIGAVINDDDAIVNSIKVNIGYAKALRRLGAKIYNYTQVTDIKVVKHKVNSVVTSEGNIPTKIVVNAAGAWSPIIGKMVGINIPIEPQRGHLIVTEQISPVTNTNVFINEADSLVFPNSNCEISFVFSQTQEGNCLIGSSREFLGYNSNVNFDVVKKINHRALQFMPIMRDVKCIRTFVGLRPYTSDGLPILSGVEKVEGFFVASGHGSKGIILGPASGRFVSKLICGEGPKQNPFKLSRFCT